MFLLLTAAWLNIENGSSGRAIRVCGVHALGDKVD